MLKGTRKPPYKPTTRLPGEVMCFRASKVDVTEGFSTRFCRACVRSVEHEHRAYDSVIDDNHYKNFSTGQEYD